MHVGRNHPLRRLFDALVRQRLYGDAQVRDPRIASYVSTLLTDFTHVNNLYRIRNARGKRIEDVAEMLVESNPLLNAASFDREREVRKHIGDYTLFLAGLFPEYIASLPQRGLRPDAFIDYIRVGKESYRVVSCFDQFEYRQEAPLFRGLSAAFESCVFGLNLVKKDLEAFQHPEYRRAQSALSST